MLEQLYLPGDTSKNVQSIQLISKEGLIRQSKAQNTGIQDEEDENMEEDDGQELFNDIEGKMNKGEIRFSKNNVHSLYQRQAFNLSAP